MLRAEGDQTVVMPISSFENVQWNQSKSYFRVQRLLWLIYSTFGSWIFFPVLLMSFFHGLKCRFAHVLLHGLGGERHKEDKSVSQSIFKKKYDPIDIHRRTSTRHLLLGAEISNIQRTNTSTISNLSVHIQGHPNSSTSYHSLLSSWSDNGQKWMGGYTAQNPTLDLTVSQPYSKSTGQHTQWTTVPRRASNLQAEQEASATH